MLLVNITKVIQLLEFDFYSSHNFLLLNLIGAGRTHIAAISEKAKAMKLSNMVYIIGRAKSAMESSLMACR